MLLVGGSQTVTDFNYRKFFGVILLAIAVNMFVNNISVIIASVQK